MSKELTVKQLRKNLLGTLRELRLDNGLYLASTSNIYHFVWTRDCFYESLPELEENPEMFKQTYQTLLDYFIGVEEKYGKFSELIKDPDLSIGKEWRFPHPRFNQDLTEVKSPWGHLQVDSISMFLYGIYLAESAEIHVIRDEKDRKIIQLIVDMLSSIHVESLSDNSIWEEAREIHSNSLGITVCGLAAIRQLGFKVKQETIDEIYKTLNGLLPRESITKNVDLSLLSLVFPFNIVTTPVAKQIIANVEAELLRERGVIRYKNDQYFMVDGVESPWCFGFSFLSLAYANVGNMDMARYYARLVRDKTIIDGNKIPEMFLGNTDIPNINNPLGWSLALGYICLKFIENE